MLIDRDGTVASANPSAERLLEGGLRTGGTEMPFTAIRSDGSVLADDERPARMAARTGEPVTGLVLGLRRPDESVLWLRVSAVPLPSGPRDPGPVHRRRLVRRRDRGARVAARARALQRRARSSSPTSPRTTSPSRCGWSRATSQLLRRRYHGRLDAGRRRVHRLRGRRRRRGCATLIEDLLAYSRAGRGDEPRAGGARLGRAPTCCARSRRRWSRPARADRGRRAAGGAWATASQLEQLLQNLRRQRAEVPRRRARAGVGAASRRDARGWR